jgi:hypothetical protein
MILYDLRIFRSVDHQHGRTEQLVSFEISLSGSSVPDRSLSWHYLISLPANYLSRVDWKMNNINISYSLTCLEFKINLISCNAGYSNNAQAGMSDHTYTYLKSKSTDHLNTK